MRSWPSSRKKRCRKKRTSFWERLFRGTKDSGTQWNIEILFYKPSIFIPWTQLTSFWGGWPSISWVKSFKVWVIWVLGIFIYIYKDSWKPTWWNVTRIFDVLMCWWWWLTIGICSERTYTCRNMPSLLIHQTNHYCWWWACWWSKVHVFVSKKRMIFPKTELENRPKFETGKFR